MESNKIYGWSGDITKRRAKTHYYKDGKSLCGKVFIKKYMKIFDKERIGSIYFKDCAICIKKENDMLHEENVSYKHRYE